MAAPALLIDSQFHGWRIVAFCFLSQFVSMGFSIYILGIYIQPIANEFGVSPGLLGWGMAFFYLANSLVGPFVGNWVDRGQARLVMPVGAVVFALGFVALGLSSHLLFSALACLLLLAPGACMLGVLPCATLLVQWFRRHQGLAVGIAAIGISLGGFVMPPLANLLIEQLGWRHSLMVLGGVVAALMLPLAWLVVVGRPADICQHPDGDPPAVEPAAATAEPPAVNAAALLTQKTFWLLTCSVGLLSATSIIMVTFIVPYAMSTGTSAASSAFLISLYAGFAVVGKVAFGWAGDRASRRKVMIAIQLCATFGWLVMVLVEGTLPMMISAALVGMAIGGMTPLWAALIALYYGPGAFGRVKGVMTLAMLAFLIVPGPLGGYLYDLTGSYAAGFAIIWWVLPVALLCTVLLPERPR